MVLLPKEFTINIGKLDARLRLLTSSNYDGIVNEGDNFVVQWKVTPSNDDLAAVEIFWRDLTEASYNTPTPAEIQAMLAKKIDAAVEFGKALTVQTALENVIMGITQVGKTRAVADYCQKLQYYLTTGSLYAAIEELEAMEVDPNRADLGLEPFITDERLAAAKAKIQAYLGQ